MHYALHLYCVSGVIWTNGRLDVCSIYQSNRAEIVNPAGKPPPVIKPLLWLYWRTAPARHQTSIVAILEDSPRPSSNLYCGYIGGQPPPVIKPLLWLYWRTAPARHQTSIVAILEDSPRPSSNLYCGYIGAVVQR